MSCSRHLGTRLLRSPHLSFQTSQSIHILKEFFMMVVIPSEHCYGLISAKWYWGNGLMDLGGKAWRPSCGRNRCHTQKHPPGLCL